jgi:hypothetical protein
MFVKSGPLSFRGNAFERSLRMSIGKVFVEEVVCMVVDDWEALDQQFEVFRGRVVKICDSVYWRRLSIWRGNHGGGKHLYRCFEGVWREFLVSRRVAMGFINWELSNNSTRVREGYAKPSSSIPYGNIRKNTDLKWGDRKLAK